MRCNQILAISFLVSGNDLDTNLMIYCPESSFKNLLTAQIYVFAVDMQVQKTCFSKVMLSCRVIGCIWLIKPFLFVN